MGMFFNSWKDDDTQYYYESINSSDHYNRGYDDGRDSIKEECENALDKAYKKGFEAGHRKAIEELMKKLFDLFGDEIDLAYLEIKLETCNKNTERLKELDDQIITDECDQPKYNDYNCEDILDDCIDSPEFDDNQLEDSICMSDDDVGDSLYD